MTPDSIKQSELLNFSHVATRDDVLHLSAERRAELVEDAVQFLYQSATKAERDDLLSLIQTIVKSDETVTQLFSRTGYIVCDSRLFIRFVNNFFLKRSNIDDDDILGKSLYHEREYEGTELERLYSMVMETRMLADALVRYVALGHNGWFVTVVVPLDDGGIGVLSLFAKEKTEVAAEIDPNSPDAPRFILMSRD